MLEQDLSSSSGMFSKYQAHPLCLNSASHLHTMGLSPTCQRETDAQLGDRSLFPQAGGPVDELPSSQLQFSVQPPAQMLAFLQPSIGTPASSLPRRAPQSEELLDRKILHPGGLCDFRWPGPGLFGGHMTKGHICLQVRRTTPQRLKQVVFCLPGAGNSEQVWQSLPASTGPGFSCLPASPWLLSSRWQHGCCASRHDFSFSRRKSNEE